nr:hypothetical protein [Tanacetum cinerariifolium]
MVQEIWFLGSGNGGITVVDCSQDRGDGMMRQMGVWITGSKDPHHSFLLPQLILEIVKFGWWFEQDTGGENEDDNDKKLVMVNEEGMMS